MSWVCGGGVRRRSSGGVSSWFFHFLSCPPPLWHFWPGPSAEMCRGFCCVTFAGFYRGLCWRKNAGTFAHKEKKKLRRHIREYNLQTFERGMTFVVLEQFGWTAPGAQAIFNRMINHRLQFLVRQGLPFSYAKRTASSELWGPISATLLKAEWPAHVECAPRIGRSSGRSP